MKKTKKKYRRKKNYKTKLKRRMKSFFMKLKKAILVTAVIMMIVIIVPSCIPTEYIPSILEEVSISNLISRMGVFDDVIKKLEGTVGEVHGVLDDVTGILKAINRTLHSDEEEEAIGLDSIPVYAGSPYVVINNNVPSFTKEELTTKSYEYYSELDLLGRCGTTLACISRDLMPAEERGPIGMVKPTGWKLKKYDIVDGKYIFNRCHLIGYQLTGENANVKNLITGTRYMNVEGMLPFENEVAEYIRKTGNHVMYRVIPIFEGNNLVASGVSMEAYSVEDRGLGVCFHVYVYNVQPGIEIDYATGDNWLAQ